LTLRPAASIARAAAAASTAGHRLMTVRLLRSTSFCWSISVHIMFS